MAAQSVSSDRAFGESFESFRALVEHSSDGLALVDVEGFFIYVNPGITRLTGFSASELIGRSQSDMLHPDDAATALTRLAELLVYEREATTLETRIRHKRGNWIWIELRAVNRLKNPDVQALILNYHDITERKEAQAAKDVLEAQLRQSQKMEAIGRLAGGIAHDFNNLLSVMLNYAGFVADTLDEQDERRGDLQQIRDAADKAANLVRHLLAFSRQEVNRPEVVDVNDVVDKFAEMLQRAIGEDVVLSVKKTRAPWMTSIDPTQLEQVLMNLAVNARDAMPAGGRMMIETANEIVDEAISETAPGLHPGAYVTISVSDTGCGMSPEIVQQVFEPFFTTKSRPEGTGLGLSTVYGIVKQAGGYVSVYSELDIGTTFNVYLPVTTEPATPPSGHVEAPTAVAGYETVLLVEDDQAVRLLVARLLRTVGYTVIPASSGDEAVQIGERSGESIDLILTDIVMPDMSGQEVARRFSDLHDTPVLFMSGYSEEMAARRGVLAGEEHFIHKPFTRDQLLAKVRDALDGRADGGPSGASESGS